MRDSPRVLQVWIGELRGIDRLIVGDQVGHVEDLGVCRGIRTEHKSQEQSGQNDWEELHQSRHGWISSLPPGTTTALSLSN